MSIRIQTILLILPLVVILGCCPCNQTQTSNTPLSIDFSSGGGVSGRHSGYIIMQDGTVRHWESMKGVRENEETVGQLDSEVMDKLRRYVDDSGIFDLVLEGEGNMTTRLTVIRGERSITHSWSGSTAAQYAPENLQPFITYLNEQLLAFDIE